MRGRDQDTGEFLAPSRSAQRRAALDVLALGQKLSTLTDAQLARLPIPDGLLPHIVETRRITSHVEAWGELLCPAAGLPPVPEGVTAMPSRRGRHGVGH